MFIKLTFFEKREAEKFILICIIGLMDSLHNNLINICEVENALFSPHTVHLLNKKKINKDIIELIELGCELEDIESLVPDQLESSIMQIKEVAMKLLSQIEQHQNLYDAKKWIDKDE